MRREYKYLIDERLAERVRRAIDGFCVPDANAPDGRYLCDTLYLDTLDLGLYRATVENERVRYKLRVRSYPQTPRAPVFLEVKRRVDDVIVKSRARVAAEAWPDLLETGDLERVAPDQRDDGARFLARYHARALVPQVLVRYEREPYTSIVDDYVRVTFDREIAMQPCPELTLRADDHWVPIDAGAPSPVVLELKFGSRAPRWMVHLVRALELPRLSFSKYARAIESMRRPVRRTARGWAP
ncbi:MAG TPA: polyphosphate polymerase domain-containing protein [Kofleriaceae bacterium]|nr:polyphosphate polymerase domain-containing protein [Kofleriaceae bacterium]